MDGALYKEGSFHPESEVSSAYKPGLCILDSKIEGLGNEFPLRQSTTAEKPHMLYPN